MKLNIDSAIENSTGYTLKATFINAAKSIRNRFNIFSLEEAFK